MMVVPLVSSTLVGWSYHTHMHFTACTFVSGGTWGENLSFLNVVQILTLILENADSSYCSQTPFEHYNEAQNWTEGDPW